MTRFFLTIQYDGTKFGGWQRQKNAENTIQQVLEEALEKVVCHTVTVFASGRTDVGVHAYGQTLHFDTTAKRTIKQIKEGANYYLPPEINVLEARIVPDNFHARYDVKQKTYVYKIYFGTRDVFKNNKWFYSYMPLDIVAMNNACACLLGTHDFKAFMTKGSSIKSTIRNVSDAKVTLNNNEIEFNITADGFLYNMVRIIASLLVKIGMGKLPVEKMQQALESGVRKEADKIAPPYALYLKNVEYI